MTRIWAAPAAVVDWVTTTTHERRAFTCDETTHAASDHVPCWCGATDAPARGLNVISSLPWTPGGVAWLVDWLGTADRSTLRPSARNMSGILEPLPPETVAPCDLTEADLLAAWTAGDEAEREALTVEMQRRDSADAFARDGVYVSSREAERPNIDLEYAGYLHSEFLAATEATNGYMVTAAGRRKGYDGEVFFRVGRRPSVERWGTEELRAWFRSGDAAQSDTAGSGHVLSKTEYAASVIATRELVAA